MNHELTAVKETHFKLAGQTNFYKGKVRDVYTIDNQYLVMVVSDRISAFDVVLPEPIPYKGQVLNQIAAKFLEATSDIVPNWVIDVPLPNVTIGRICDPFKVEMVIRGYLAGHAWREYSAGKRLLCGVPLPEGLIENDKLPEPIITPTTKASVGHDEDISKEQILARGIVSAEDYDQLEKYTHALYQRGTEIAADQGLILVDTKYEFGKADGQIFLIDEIHTPDSSRYFYSEGYAERQQKDEPQKQLSKEFVRKWLIENGFQGKDGQVVPLMTKEIVASISERYIELYEKITGEKFVKGDNKFVASHLQDAINIALTKL
jgi:phosphoribosylaminoimidazole-succinocarboxamide synthase